jgi:hypothetical protein
MRQDASVTLIGHDVWLMREAAYEAATQSMDNGYYSTARLHWRIAIECAQAIAAHYERRGDWQMAESAAGLVVAYMRHAETCQRAA